MNFLRRASTYSNRWVEKGLALFGFSMAAIVMLQVFCRYVLNHSLFWSEELARYLLIWLTFLGASSAYYRKLHPGVDLLTQRLWRPLQKACKISVYLISMSFFGVMIYYGVSFAYFIRHQISPALAIPKWIVVSIIPFSGCLFLLHCLVFLLSELKEPLDDD